jgi:hypothetical protein
VENSEETTIYDESSRSGIDLQSIVCRLYLVWYEPPLLYLISHLCEGHKRQNKSHHRIIKNVQLEMRMSEGTGNLKGMYVYLVGAGDRC